MSKPCGVRFAPLPREELANRMSLRTSGGTVWSQRRGLDELDEEMEANHKSDFWLRSEALKF